MKASTIAALIGMVAAALPAVASTISVGGSDSETGLTSSVSYALRTTGNNSVNGGQSGFTPITAQSVLSTLNGVDYVNYLTSLPGGATLTGATLNFAGLFSSLVDSSAISDGHFFFQPGFSSVLSPYTVKITSTLANVSVSGSSATGYNLWTIFQNDIKAGHAIDVTWSVVDTFGADISAYGNTCKSCSEKFLVTSTANFTASNTANSLVLSYNSTNDAPPTGTPEPASMALAGVALMGLGVIGRRKRSQLTRGVQR